MRRSIEREKHESAVGYGSSGLAGTDVFTKLRMERSTNSKDLDARLKQIYKKYPLLRKVVLSLDYVDNEGMVSILGVKDTLRISLDQLEARGKALKGKKKK